MYRYNYLTAILHVIFIPLPTLQHFVWPLGWCVLADICNHTWIPECGNDGDKRLFIDDCDMFEYNCDHNRKYKITNYSDCFQYSQCPTLGTKRYYRMGNYMYMQENRKVVYAPTTPSLPMYMLRGKRRHTPTPKIQRKMLTARSTTKHTTRKLVVLNRIPMVKNGKVLVKIVKGYTKVKPKTVKEVDSSDYLQK
ncbi:hypothetical protein K1T71_012281 [Dendrolimus kikuchii]|uniref:Uncharacterized protein n=1 Tax=Dendrolimus kikuchii TaxID=765133 RepID=A0ACC1CL32_9NEOP|nr:hypothetical protein K1T71_012281 [Dendrolimus kikuchii]